MNVPLPAPIKENGVDFPYCIVGDEAFPLKPYLLRPYPGKTGCSKEQRVFNYRLSRARRTIENAFGILANRWQIFRKAIRSNTENTIKIVKAAVCLHNWLRMSDLEGNENVQYVSDYETNALRRNQDENPCNNFECLYNRMEASSKEAIVIREKFRKYFNNEGAVEWQYKYI